MVRNFKKVALCTLLCLSSYMTFGQFSESKYDIKLGGNVFQTKLINFSDLQIRDEEVFQNKRFYLIQFYQIPTDEDIIDWKSRGLFISDYLSGLTYYCITDKNFNLIQLSNKIRTIVPQDTYFKMEASLYNKRLDQSRFRGTEPIKIILSYFDLLDGEKIIEDLRSKNVIVESHRPYARQLYISFNESRLNEISNLPYVQFIGEQPQNPVLENDPKIEGEEISNSSGRSNYLNTGFNGLNYNGAGQTVNIGENGRVLTMPDFKGRLTEVLEGDLSFSSHKVGVIQYAGGGGNIDPTLRSNAWGANFISSNNTNYPDMLTNYGVRYTNHSYGFSIAGGYDLSARDRDLLSESHPNSIVIYSAGNSGTSTGFAPYAHPGWSNITGTVKQNKNHLNVGSLLPNDNLGSFSSRGPTYDGRIFPQVVIEGIGGTSNAAPKVTGLFAILNQVYRDKNANIEPPSALLKAVILNSADDVENLGPDHVSGYGRPNMRRAYKMINENKIITSSITNGVVNNHSITVPANVKQFRVLITWPDKAAAVNANPAIVNNLDLKVSDPSSIEFFPWILQHNPASAPANLSLPAVRGRDSINTIEQITVDNPTSGVWNIAVNGFNIPSGPQTYYLTYEFLTEEIQFMFPLKDEKLKSGEIYHLKWDSYGDNAPFTIEYQLNGGNWNLIVSGYDQTKRSYEWFAPFVNGIQNIKFRITKSSLTSESDVNQIGIVPTNFRVVKVCNDIVTLKWDGILGATSYKIYRLGAKYMEEVTTNITFSGNSAVLTGQSTLENDYYALSAVTGTIEGQRTMGITRTPGDINCSSISWVGTTSTDWFTGTNWSSSPDLPTINDNVIIPSTAANQPMINNSTAICKAITIEVGASLTMHSSISSQLTVHGDWINNGSFIRGVDTIQFAGDNILQEISGSSNTSFNFLKVNKASLNQILEVNSLITLHGAVNPLRLTKGTFKLSSASTLVPFTNSSGADFVGGKGLWVNGGVINSGNFSWGLNGGSGGALLRVSAGVLNVGSNSGNSITYLNNPSIIIEGGELNIAGRFNPNSGSSSASYAQHGGILRVNTVGSASTSIAPFAINASVPFTMTEGSIIVSRQSSNIQGDIIIASSTHNVIGGTIQIGDISTPTNQTIKINSTVPLNNLLVKGNSTTKLQVLTNDLTVKKELKVESGEVELVSPRKIIVLGTN